MEKCFVESSVESAEEQDLHNTTRFREFPDKKIFEANHEVYTISAQNTSQVKKNSGQLTPLKAWLSILNLMYAVSVLI